MAKHIIKAHLPGTFYHKPAPDQPTYKSAGDAVRPGDVIGLIEVMKSYHEVKATVKGQFNAYLTEDGDAISPSQDLAEIQIN